MRSRHVVLSHSVQAQYCSSECGCQVTSGGLSLRSPLNETHPPQWENGPDGIRTRIFDLDRVPCYRLHHGPKSSFRSRNRRGKATSHKDLERVPNRERCASLVIPRSGATTNLLLGSGNSRFLDTLSPRKHGYERLGMTTWGRDHLSAAATADSPLVAYSSGSLSAGSHR